MKLQRFLHRMNQRAGSSQIFGQALPCRARGQAEDPAASMQAASHKLEDCFLTKCCCWAGCCWGGNLAQIQNGRLQSDFLAKRGCEPLRTLSCASVCVCGRRVLTGCSLQAEVRGLGEEMAPFESPYLPSLSGSPQSGRHGTVYGSWRGLPGDSGCKT